SGDPMHGDPFLGNPLGPDADRWNATLGFTPGVRWSLWLRGESTRRGDGNRDLAAWQPGAAYRLPFPRGVVQRSGRIEARARPRPGRYLQMQGAIARDDQAGARAWRLSSELRVDF